MSFLVLIIKIFLFLNITGLWRGFFKQHDGPIDKSTQRYQPFYSPILNISILRFLAA